MQEKGTEYWYYVQSIEDQCVCVVGSVGACVEPIGVYSYLCHVGKRIAHKYTGHLSSRSKHLLFIHSQGWLY